MLEFFADKEELEKALKRLQELEERGFTSSLAGFQLKSIGPRSSDDQLKCSDEFILMADPVDESLQWGRIQGYQIGWFYYDGNQMKEVSCE